MLDLGFRTHDFGKKFESAQELGQMAKSYKENSCLHFAPYKAFNDVPRPLTEQWASNIKKGLDEYGIKVAILGCYINPVHPTNLEAELSIFENGIDVAKSLGNPIVATETGSHDEKYNYDPETWSAKSMYNFLKTMERLLKRAEDKGVTIAIEAVAEKTTIDTPERMYQVMETFKSPNLRCLFDAVNILPIYGVDNFYTYYDEAISKLAPYISVMHLKDFVWSNDTSHYPHAHGPVKKGTIAIGEGLMPWKTLFGIYKKYGVDKVPMTLENFNPATLANSLKYIESCYANC
ncbi:MAG: sugar phosphate isomerase/epimerase [Sphaerochaetaceae bacterium]|nr:sugar phosphate isomerase/epimerase [Sphaerochaetaceae bacterium]